MPTIVPAILENSVEAFAAKVSVITKVPGVERIQVDFGDGKFVGNSMVNINELDMLNPAFMWEAHLMCESPMEFLDYQICGFNTIIVHHEAYPQPGEVKKALLKIRESGMHPAVAINPETPVEVLAEYADMIKHFQLMAIHPGFQGTTLLPQTAERVAALRKLLPNAIIEVDGGINETNIKSIREAGADLICVGSSLVKAQDVNLAYEKLLAAMN